MNYSIFLDDVRSVKMIFPDKAENEFIIVRNYNEFVKVIEANALPEFISFDNDLGIDASGEIAPDGYECAKWLVYKSGLDLRNLKYFVHSANPVAKAQINSLLENYIIFQKRNAK